MEAIITVMYTPGTPGDIGATLITTAIMAAFMYIIVTIVQKDTAGLQIYTEKAQEAAAW